jgi:hypothetical protein
MIQNMKFKLSLYLVPLLILSINSAYCKTIKGIDIPEQIAQPDSQQPLILNGAGIRRKFFISIYIGALYLPKKQRTVTSILQSNSPRRVMMYCLYHEISKDKLIDAWNEGFNENTSEQVLKQLHERITEFNKLFPALRKGDIVILDYIPDKGTTLTFNNKELGVIPGEDFNIALLKVWLGEYPADSGLKAAMLGSP